MKGEEEDEAVKMQEDLEAPLEAPQISIHTLRGVHSFSTVKVVGSVGNRQLHILIHSGSTHNFINSQAAIKLRCSQIAVKPLSVSVVNGSHLSCISMCPNFQWVMQGLWFKTDVFVLPLDNYDMVVGIQWLALLDDIVWNFKKLTMKFFIEGTLCELQGIGSNGLSLCSVEKMNDLLSHSDRLAAIHLCSIQMLEPNLQDFPAVTPKVEDQTICIIKQLLLQFTDVFSVPEALPPSRGYDHHIVLK